MSDVTDTLAEIRASGCTADRMLALAKAVQDECRPADVAVLVLDKADLARVPDPVRRERLAGLLSWLSGLWPEWGIFAQRKPEPPRDAVN